jgi:mono/diheme cytochrome c family protein
MLPIRLLAVPLASLALFGIAKGADNPDAAITRAAVAPFRDELLRDAPALCSDLTPTVAAMIAPQAAPGTSCEQAVQDIFAATAATPLPRSAILSLQATASDLRIDGRRATGVFSLLTNEVSEHGSMTTDALVNLGRYRLDLEEVGGRWLVSSDARLATIPECQVKPTDCQANVAYPAFTLGTPLGSSPGESIPTPKSVQRAGRREQRVFAAGRTVFAESGCLACHRLDDLGNRGPGQNLTHIGRQLSAPQIEHALLSPRAPMPSFKGLPASKRRVLVRFLSLLR